MPPYAGSIAFGMAQQEICSLKGLKMKALLFKTAYRVGVACLLREAT